METISATKSNKILYRTLWRWHFYAGVFAVPFIIILSITGALYLFKPQLDAFHDSPYRNLALTGPAITPAQQVAAALAAVPNASFTAYELPREPSDAINILLTASGNKMRAYVHPQSAAVLAVEHEDYRFLRYVHDIHGELLLGKTGSVLVELAASWAIVLILTGVYLWWPRNSQGLAGVIYPRLHLKGRMFWRDLHSVTGIWLSALVLFLLISGLPWALVWGSAFKEIRTLTGAVSVKQDWAIAGGAVKTITQDSHAEHQQGAAHLGEPALNEALLNTLVTKTQQLHFAHPVLLMPPSEKSPDWNAKSNSQNRPLRADAYFDAHTGELKNQQNFAQRHILDRIIGIGIAAHEGQLFGWLNQLLGLITALGLIIMSVGGFMMWRKRAPSGALGAPPQMPNAALSRGLIAIIILAAILLPTLCASLIVIFILEKLLLPQFPSAQKWLGLT